MQKTSATPAASTGSRLVPASSMKNRLHTGRLPQLFSAGVRLTAILAALACLLNASPATAGQAGIDWTIQNMGFDLNWFSVTYGNGLFVAVAATGTGNRVASSGKACGDGNASTPLHWLMLALPCVPTPTGVSDVTPATVFGNGPIDGVNLNYALYDTAIHPTDGWDMYKRNVTTTPSAYEKLLTTTTLATGEGYWIKSMLGSVNNKFVVFDGTPTPVTRGSGCTSVLGCAAIRVTTVTGGNRYNLVGNPFAYAVDWTCLLYTSPSPRD